MDRHCIGDSRVTFAPKNTFQLESEYQPARFGELNS